MKATPEGDASKFNKEKKAHTIIKYIPFSSIVKVVDPFRFTGFIHCDEKYSALEKHHFRPHTNEFGGRFGIIRVKV